MNERSDSAERVRLNTSLLRESDSPFYERLRNLLTERGVEWEKCLLADSWPEDNAMELCFLVSPDRTVVEFEFHYSEKGLVRQAGEGIIWAWKSMSMDDIRSSPAQEVIEAALQMLEQG